MIVFAYPSLFPVKNYVHREKLYPDYGLDYGFHYLGSVNSYEVLFLFLLKKDILVIWAIDIWHPTKRTFFFD